MTLRVEAVEVPLPVRYCMVCRGEIPADRVAHHSATCSDHCQKQHKREMQTVRSGKKCRLCGRAFRRPRALTVAEVAPSPASGCVPGTQDSPDRSESAKNA